MTAKAMLLLTSAPNEEAARQIGTRALELQLAACITTLPGATSRYRWLGKVEEAQEILVLLKTTPEAIEALQEALAEVHPYDEPEFLQIPATGGSAGYLRWLSAEITMA